MFEPSRDEGSVEGASRPSTTNIVSVPPMTTKWASYSTTGRLTFDSSLLELREELQDYVIAHELLHFHVPNHGRLWKSLMRLHVGEHENLEGELRRVAQNRTRRGTASRQ